MNPPTTADIEATIKDLLISDLEAQPALLADVNTATPLLGRGIGLDSIEALRLALSLEREFYIHIPDADLTVELFSSMGALAHYVSGKMIERGQR